ncbi:MAG: quinolinate synthase, partial [Parasphingorhabdus sp.]
GSNEVRVDADISRKALTCIDRMLNFAAQNDGNVRPSGDLAKENKLFSGIGPA